MESIKGYLDTNSFICTLDLPQLKVYLLIFDSKSRNGHTLFSFLSTEVGKKLQLYRESKESNVFSIVNLNDNPFEVQLTSQCMIKSIISEYLLKNILLLEKEGVFFISALDNIEIVNYNVLGVFLNATEELLTYLNLECSFLIEDFYESLNESSNIYLTLVSDIICFSSTEDTTNDNKNKSDKSNKSEHKSQKSEKGRLSPKYLTKKRKTKSQIEDSNVGKVMLNINFKRYLLSLEQ